MPKCFTCVNKISIPVSPEIRKEWGKRTKKFRIPELVFICAKNELRIQQTSPACDQFEADDTMTLVAESLKSFAKKMRSEFSD